MHIPGTELKSSDLAPLPEEPPHQPPRSVTDEWRFLIEGLEGVKEQWPQWGCVSRLGSLHRGECVVVVSEKHEHLGV